MTTATHRETFDRSQAESRSGSGSDQPTTISG